MLQLVGWLLVKNLRNHISKLHGWFMCSYTGSPVNSFEFLQPLLKSLDYDLPQLSLAVPHALFLGKVFWAIYSLLYPWLRQRWIPQPLILPAEVYKVRLMAL